MSRIRKLIIGIALATGGPAWAQETGTLITHKSAEIDGRGRDAARATMEAFAACTVSRFTGRAEALADVPVDSPRYERLFRNMYDSYGDECLSGMEGGTLSFSSGLFRGALFQALYEREFKRDAPTDFSAVTDTGYLQLYSSPLSAEARTALALERFGECVARADARGVQKLLRQRPGSSDEDQAINALRPTFAACIPRDQTIRFSPSILKGAVAEGIYRLSKAARALNGRTQ
jgi:hypothetical protein